MEKALVPTIDGEGKPPVRLLVLDTEEQEAVVIAQVRRAHVLYSWHDVVRCSTVQDSTLQYVEEHEAAVVAQVRQAQMQYNKQYHMRHGAVVCSTVQCSLLHWSVTQRSAAQCSQYG